MRSVLTLVLFAVAGILAGGAVSLRRQGARWTVVGVIATLAAIAAAGGVLRLVSDF